MSGKFFPVFQHIAIDREQTPTQREAPESSMLLFQNISKKRPLQQLQHHHHHQHCKVQLLYSLSL
jgi:hypothetical protein